MKRSQFTLRSLIVVVVVLASLAAIIIPTFMRVRRQWSIGNCSGNLRSLWQAQFNYAQRHPRVQGIMPTETGADFWLKLQRGTDPVLDRYEPFFCVFSEDEVAPGRTSYRGPAANVNKLDDLDPVGADREGNHGPGEGGNILTKLGDVAEYSVTDPLWIRARTTTKE